MDEDKNRKIYKFIKDGLMNVVVGGVALVYIFYNMITLESNDISVWECLIKGAMGIICGVMIKQGLGENGFSRGYNSSIWADEMVKYNALCNEANKYMERVDNFYYTQEIEKRIAKRRAILMGARLKYNDFFDDKENFIDDNKFKELPKKQKRAIQKCLMLNIENAEMLKRIRESILIKAEMHYDDWFDSMGRYVDPRYNKLTKFQKKAIKKCLKVKIYNLNLFSEYSDESTADTKKEITDSGQRKRTLGKNAISQIVIAISGAYFYPMLSGWSWGAFIASTAQVILWIIIGVLQLYTNYNFIVVEKVNKLKRKKELIQKFIFGCENGMYQTNPYEDREIKYKMLPEKFKGE